MPTLSNSRVLVTGGAGLIGSHLVDLLRRERNAEVVILDNLEPQTHPNGRPTWVPTDARFVLGDVRSEQDLRTALEGVRFVFHLAAFGGFSDSFSKYLDVNAGGTSRLFEAIRERGAGVEKVVVASSQGIYGEGAYVNRQGAFLASVPLRGIEQLRAGVWEHLDPDTGEPLQPIPTPIEKFPNSLHVYSISKYAAERTALSLGRQWGIDVCALRYAVTYGPRQSVYNPYTGVVSIFSTQLLNDKRPQIYEDGNQTRDFVSVADNARANLFAMEHGGTAGQVLNVGTGRATRIRDVVATLGALLGKDLPPLVTGHFRPSDVRHIVLDPSGLAALGFRCETSFPSGLGSFVEWIRSQGAVVDRFTAAQQSLIDAGVVHAPRV